MSAVYSTSMTCEKHCIAQTAGCVYDGLAVYERNIKHKYTTGCPDCSPTTDFTQVSLTERGDDERPISKTFYFGLSTNSVISALSFWPYNKRCFKIAIAIIFLNCSRFFIHFSDQSFVYTRRALVIMFMGGV